MEAMETKNAIITGATLDVERGLLTAWLHLDYGGSGQGFGGRVLYVPEGWTHHGGPNFAGHFIWRVMQVADVERWADLVGKALRVRGTNHQRIEAIGHIVKDDWFNPGLDFEAMKAKAPAAEATH